MHLLSLRVCGNYFVPDGNLGRLSAISNAIDVLSLTGHLPCIIHKFSKDPLLLLCTKAFWIFTLKTLFSEKSLKLRRIIQDL